MPKGLPVKITSGGYRTGGSLVVDGLDISHHTESLSLCLELGAGAIPRLSINIVGVAADAEVDAEVVIPNQLAELLTKLGWTPPAAETATTEGK